MKPAKIAELEAVRCGVDKTAPWLLEKSSARWRASAELRIAPGGAQGEP